MLFVIKKCRPGPLGVILMLLVTKICQPGHLSTILMLFGIKKRPPGDPRSPNLILFSIKFYSIPLWILAVHN